MNLSDDKVNIDESVLRELCNADGISSDEKSVSIVIEKYLKDLCDFVETDESGNLLGYVSSKKSDAKTLLMEAHMDKIGLMVTKVNADGSLSFTNVGGIDERILPYSEVEIIGKSRLKGIIYPYKTEKDKNPTYETMKIETGYSKAETESLVEIGDIIIPKSKYTNLCGSVISCGGLDNRAGVFSILKALSSLKKDNLKYNIILLFSVREELGFHGTYAAEITSVDAAISVDVTHGETKDSKETTGVFPLGSGAVVCRGPNLDDELTRQLISLSDNMGLPYDIEVASSSSGTNAWAIQTRGCGIPSMLVSIPLRYMHTTTETVDFNDLISVADLLQNAAEGGIEI